MAQRRPEHRSHPACSDHPHAQALVSSTLAAKTPTTATISGSLARIELDGDFYAPNRVRLVSPSGESITSEAPPVLGHQGLAYEAAHFAQLVADGFTESPQLPLDETIRERFIAILVEHYAGAFPAWLSPVQVLGIPVSSDYDEYLGGIAAELLAADVRIEVDRSDDRFGKKIRNAQTQKVPFMLIAGETDAAAGAVSFRYRDGSQRNGVPIAEAVAEIVAATRPPRR